MERPEPVSRLGVVVVGTGRRQLKPRGREADKGAFGGRTGGFMSGFTHSGEDGQAGNRVIEPGWVEN